MTLTPKNLIADLLLGLPDGEVLDVRIGLHWTAVVIETEGERRCGLASTLPGTHEHGGEPDIPEAGQLLGRPAAELAAYLASEHPTRSGLGLATVNALLPRQPQRWNDQNAGDTILELGAGKRVVLIGHFPFVPQLRQELQFLEVLELNPLQGDLPASEAPRVLPQAEVVAITGMSLHNGTLGELLDWCSPEARVMLLGPSTPLSPVMFDYGVDLLAGSIIEKIEPVLQVVSQGGNFRQVRRAGVRLVTITAD
jgi:uncharacterized protein (DUF4213/DUF364 family)